LERCQRQRVDRCVMHHTRAVWLSTTGTATRSATRTGPGEADSGTHAAHDTNFTAAVSLARAVI